MRQRSGSESGLHPPEQRHARTDVGSHHDRRLPAADRLARQAPRVFPGRGGRRPHDRSRLSALGSAEDDPVGKIEQEGILVEDRKRMQRMDGRLCRFRQVWTQQARRLRKTIYLTDPFQCRIQGTNS